MQRVGAYEVLYELKSGGMGSVLLARRRGPGSFEKLVAIKTIRAELAAAPQVRAMFLDEAALLARLGHPAVAAVHDFGEEGKNLYLVMEYVAGVSLHGVLDHVLPPPHIAARLVAEACRGIHAAHELRDLQGNLLGVVHRDISPDNLLLGFDGHVKVIDFGIALIKGRQAPVTEMGMLKGKPPYMSPEQIKNEPIDRRSDVFALGAVLWEMLVGEPLFTGDSIYAIARAVEHQEIERPSARVAGLLPGLDSIVLEALQRDPARRTPTAAALAARLDEVVAAAEGETLAEWSHRELATQREEHRRWLAQVMSGGESARKAGRATGAVTALALPAPGEGAGGPVGVAAVAAEAIEVRMGEGRAAQGRGGMGELPTQLSTPVPGQGMQVAAESRGSGGRGSLGGLSVSAGGADVRDSDGPVPGRLSLGTQAGVRGETQGGARGETSGDGLDELAAPAPRRHRFAVGLVLAVLAAGGAWWGGMRRGPASSGDVGVGELAAGGADAGAIAIGAVDAGAGGAGGDRDARLAASSPDAAIAEVPRADAAAVPATPDAAVSADATADPASPSQSDKRNGPPGRRNGRPRSAENPADAGAAATPPVSAPRDAAEPPERPAPPERQVPTEEPEVVQGTGKLDIVAEPYATVVIDGKTIGPTPRLNYKISAGRHTVTLTDPVTGEVLLTKTVTVPADGKVRVARP